MDDVTATIIRIKNLLKSLSFAEKKIIISISSGAQIYLLYSYLVKNHPLDIKYIFDNIGPISVSPFDYLIIKEEIGTLPSIEPEDIKETNKIGKIKFLKEGREYYQPQYKLIFFMIALLGRKFNVLIKCMTKKNKKLFMQVKNLINY